jgi:phosphatidylglycerophosphate synthase
MSIRTTVLTREARWVFARASAAMAAGAALLALLGALRPVPAIAVVLGFAGMLVGLDRALPAHHSHARFGAANRVTLLRAGIAGLMLARALDPGRLVPGERWLLAGIAALALGLDGIDGRAARRQGLASPFGAGFDMETDAFAILVLSLLVAKTAAVPFWVLAIGAMRYLHLAAGRVCVGLRRPPPPRRRSDRRRQTIAVVQSLALILALIPATPPAVAAIGCAAALALLVYSFAADIGMAAPRRTRNEPAGNPFASPYDAPSRRQGDAGARP